MKDFSFYTGLIFDCSNNNEQDDCPLKNLRALNDNDKLAVWSSMNNEEKIKVIKHHIKCLRRL